MIRKIRFNDWYSRQLELEDLILDGKIQPPSQKEIDEAERRARKFLSEGSYSKDKRYYSVKK
jgi:hypothetical protein